MIPSVEASARKKEIEAKLEQEQDMLTFIRENLQKSDQLTGGMVSILSSFESRLVQLENAIIPVHRQTENLQRLQDNVDRTLSCLDHVISYYHVAKDTDRTIREGPADRLDEYLVCMDKVQKAVEFFQENNPDSPDLNTVKALFEKGKELLEAEFRGLLTRYSKPVPPVLVLEMLGVEEEQEAQEEVTLEHLPEPVLQDLVCISSWLLEHARNQDFMNVYFQVRSSQLDGSLKGLKEHFRKISAPSVVFCSSSPAVQAKRKDTPTKKPPRRPVDPAPNHSQAVPLTCLRYTGAIRKVLKQYSQPGAEGRIGAAALPPLEGKDDMQDVEIDSYIYCVSAFVKLAQSEYALLAHIIPEHHQKKTFDSLIQEALDSLMQEGESIVAVARRAIGRHDYSAVLTIFPILRHLKLCKPEFYSALQGTAASTKNKLPTLIISMETIGAKALEEFADSIKNDPDKEYNMPKDGTVHELASNGHTVSTAVAGLPGNGRRHAGFPRGAIFLLNNYNYILQSLEKSELIQLVAVTHKKAESSYQELIEQQIQVYQRSWWRVTEYLMDRNTPTFQPGTKLKDKERQLIKDKFKGFNDGLEELCKVQKAWAIPDKEQRDTLRQVQKTVVSEAYRMFLHRYANISFTKNLDKYLKYRPEQVEEMIGRLFDTSA
ncbi:hypothetical protein SKAU_G00429650 [Synaphobranchus kaupii]|uniref:Exocyst complex component 7 n=1 Tax=Synaphobranchus kaupii TaxID=118154 RepID=A0A9Q1I9Y6_SYNKA|nr:hypothetical protein SKAU_G00429650 [Synaphobranchus kaupii]